ncbi:MAG: hypothetical protein N2316_09990 [Spirochaetes bacterium]|nr:hypothetical protein [Spirochaetota bacterium]
MKHYVHRIFVAIVPFTIAFCASAQRATIESSIDFPSLTEANYKLIDTSNQLTGIYLYNPTLGKEHIEIGDSNAKALSSTLAPKVKFYKLNVSTLSTNAQKELVQKYLGEPTLPSYLFLYKNRLLTKKVGAYKSATDATLYAEKLRKEFETTIWKEKKEK